MSCGHYGVHPFILKHFLNVCKKAMTKYFTKINGVFQKIKLVLEGGHGGAIQDLQTPLQQGKILLNLHVQSLKKFLQCFA